MLKSITIHKAPPNDHRSMTMFEINGIEHFLSYWGYFHDNNFIAKPDVHFLQGEGLSRAEIAMVCSILEAILIFNKEDICSN